MPRGYVWMVQPIPDAMIKARAIPETFGLVKLSNYNQLGEYSNVVGTSYVCRLDDMRQPPTEISQKRYER
jgi:hypothetical protein